MGVKIYSSLSPAEMSSENIVDSRLRQRLRKNGTNLCTNVLYKIQINSDGVIHSEDNQETNPYFENFIKNLYAKLEGNNLPSFTLSIERGLGGFHIPKIYIFLTSDIIDIASKKSCAKRVDKEIYLIGKSGGEAYKNCAVTIASLLINKTKFQEFELSFHQGRSVRSYNSISSEIGKYKWVTKVTSTNFNRLVSQPNF